MSKHTWGVYLRPNTITTESERDCIAEVYSPQETRRNKDIAERITSERSEYRAETIINILSMRDRAVKEFIEEGYSVMDGIVHIHPRVSGVWEDESAHFDPKVHKRTVDMAPTADLRAALDEISVNVLGSKDITCKINAITDAATGLTDGSITIGDDIVIDGEKIKIDELDSEQGIFFKTADGTEYHTTRRLTVNRPSQLIARVPKDLPEGEVWVIVRTKFSGGGNELKEIRSIEYKYACRAKN